MPESELSSAAINGSLGICDIAITPECIKALYNITDPTTAAEGNELGIFESIADVYAQEDLNLFFLNFAP